MIKIEKGIPIPSTRNGKTYPFEKMEIGDSFYVSLEESGLKHTNSLANSILGSGRKNRFKGKKFTTRSDDNGVRCWRIE